MQFLTILDNFWQFWIILGNFWTIFWIFDNFCTIFRHFINITSTTIFSTLCSFRIMHVSSLHHHYVTVWWSGSGLRLIRDEIRDPEWNPGIRRKHMQRHPRFRIKKNRSRLVEQPRKETTIAFYSNTDYAFTPGPISPYNLKKMLQSKWCLFFGYSYYLILIESCNILK